MTEKQVVPKYMADWLKFCKDNGFKLLEGVSPYASAMEEYLDDFEGDIQEVLKWIRHNPDEFARAWVNGYEVDKLTKYSVQIKGVKYTYAYLKYSSKHNYWYFSDATVWYEPFRYNDVQRHFEVVGNIYENKNMIGYGDNNE